MARDNRLWQNPLAHARIFEGDAAECNKWYAWAQQKLRFMLSSHPGATSQVFTPAADVMIKVDTRPNRIAIKAGSGSLYLESGFYELISSAICAEGTYKPATLHYNTPIATYITSLVAPKQGGLDIKTLGGEPIEDGFRSISVGAKTLLNSVTDPCGMTYQSITPAYVKDQEAHLMKKQTQNRVPASMFSGKMRMYVQSVYGSNRTDYRINVGIDGLPVQGDYSLFIDDSQGKRFELVWGYPYTCGIYTTDEYRHYLLKVTTTEIWVFPLKISAEAETLRKKMAAQKSTLPVEDLEKLEAYLLSTAVPDTVNWYKRPVDGGSSLGGVVLGYGWKFSQSGKKCTVVIHSDASVAEDESSFTARQITVTVTETNGILSATSIEDATGYWHHGNFLVVWSPDFFQYSQAQVGKYNTSSSISATDTPLYGWYEGEEYRPLLFNANVAYRNESVAQANRQIVYGCGATDLSEQPFGNYLGYNGTVSVTMGEGVNESIEYIYATAFYTNYYYWTVDVAENDIVTTSQLSSNVGIYMCDLGVTGVGYLLGNGSWAPSGPYWAIVWTDHGTYLTGKSLTYYNRQLKYDQIGRGTVSDRGKISVIIPLKDAESATVCSRQIRQQTTANSAYGRRGGNSLTESLAQDCTLRWDNGGSPFIESRGETYVLIENPIFSFDLSGTIVANPGGTTEVAALTTSEKMVGFSKITEDGYTLKSTSGTAGSAVWADPYIQGTLYQPLTKTIVTVSSYNGATITYHSEGTGENRNGFRNDSSVGWA